MTQRKRYNDVCNHAPVSNVYYELGELIADLSHLAAQIVCGALNERVEVDVKERATHWHLKLVERVLQCLQGGA